MRIHTFKYENDAAKHSLRRKVGYFLVVWIPAFLLALGAASLLGGLK